jgi:hypothetical protein
VSVGLAVEAPEPAGGKQDDAGAVEDELGPGSPLPTTIRSKMETGLGRSLGGVVLHTSGAAGEAVRSRGARALTVGGHVAVAPEWYRPGSLAGDALLAHELAHTVQQGFGPGPPSLDAPAGGTSLEHEADAAAATTLLRAHAGAPLAAPSIRPSGGLRLQRCNGDSHPVYAAVGGGPTTTEVAAAYAGARSSNWMSTFRDGAYRMTIDGDGDQSAELELVARPQGSTGRWGAPASVELTITRIGNVAGTSVRAAPQTRTFDVQTYRTTETYLGMRLAVPTDGRSPTEIDIGGNYLNPVARLSVHPPSPEGATATYKLVLTKALVSGQMGDPQERTVDFARSETDAYQVFRPGAVNRAGAVWSVDAEVGMFGDAFRFSLHKPSPSATSAVLGISPRSGTRALSASRVDVPVAAAPLQVAVVPTGGARFALDLDGDGRADIFLWDYLTPGTDDSGADRRLERSHIIRVTSATGADLGQGRTTISRGEFVASSVSAVAPGTEFEAHAAAVSATQLPQERHEIDSEIRQIETRLAELRRLAGERNLIATSVLDSWTRTTNAWLAVLTAADAAKPSLARQAAMQARAFDRVWTEETRTGTRTVMGQVSSSSNAYTGTESISGYPVGNKVSTATKLATALDLHNYAGAGLLHAELDGRVNQWVAVRLRAGGLEDEAESAKQLGSLLPRLYEVRARPGVRRVAAIFHPAPEYTSDTRVPATMPLRIFVWKDGSSWYLRDLTKPNTDDPLSVSSTDALPPPSLFALLNDDDRFPKGYVHYEVPGARAEDGAWVTVASGVVTCTAPWDLSDVLTWIGLGIAAVAFVVGTAGAGSVVVGSLWAASGVVTAAAAVAHMVEEQQAGRLTAGVVVMDIAQIIGAAAGAVTAGTRALSAYRVASAARLGTPGAVATATANAGRVATNLVPLLYTQVAGDLVQVVLMSGTWLDQLAAIDRNRSMSDSEKFRAKLWLILQAGGTIALTAVAVRGNATEIRQAMRSADELVHLNGHTLLPGAYDAARYERELAGHLSPEARDLVAGRVQTVNRADFEARGSSIGLAAVEVRGGRPVVLVPDGVPPSVLREEAAHIEQLLLMNRPAQGLTEAQRRVRTAAIAFTEARSRWASLTPEQKVTAHQSRLFLEEDAAMTVIRRLDADIAAGVRPEAATVEAAWRNLEAIRHLSAELSDVRRAVRSGQTLENIRPDLLESPVLYAKRAGATGATAPAWRLVDEDTFVREYRARYPDTSLTDAELRQRHQQQMRLNPGTGRLSGPEFVGVDVPARYLRGGQAERLRLTPTGGQPGDEFTRLDPTRRGQWDALLEARDRARHARDTAGTRGDVDARNQAQYRVNEASRQLGEMSGDIWVRHRYRTAELRYPPPGAGSRSGDFDRVYRCVDADGKVVWVIIEAKGGAAELGSRRVGTQRVEQGTREYLDDVLNAMERSGGALRTAADEIRTARRTAGVGLRYVEVRAPVELTAAPAGTASGPGLPSTRSSASSVEVKEFDLTPQGTTSTTNTGVPNP